MKNKKVLVLVVVALAVAVVAYGGVALARSSWS
jgi:hypothetical protein